MAGEVQHNQHNEYDVIGIGVGKAGLALGSYLRRSGPRYAVLDAQEGPGGAWRHTGLTGRVGTPADG